MIKSAVYTLIISGAQRTRWRQRMERTIGSGVMCEKLSRKAMGFEGSRRRDREKGFLVEKSAHQAWNAHTVFKR